jgi:phage/plasmid-associated DNA primase
MDRTPGQTQDTWEKWGNSVSRFEKVCLEEDGSTDIAKSDVYAAYVNFCESEGIPTETQHMLTRELKLEGYEDGRKYLDNGRERVFLGTAFTGRGEEFRDNDHDDEGGATGGGSGLDSY